MKKTASYFAIVYCIVFLLVAGSCTNPPENVTTKNDDTNLQMVTHPDMVKVKKEIQAIASRWAAAENARDAKAVADLFAEDAIKLPNNRLMIFGKEKILKSIENELANVHEGDTISMETLDVYGNELDVVEVGRFTQKDSTGKIIYTGRYLTYWQNRNGKYLAVRDMTNEDGK
jgi:ketosteroid isomerase-like protein